MAVRAHQNPLNAFSARSNAWEEYQQLQHPGSTNLMSENAFGSYHNTGGTQLLTGIVFSDPESDLKCNASGCRKRSREIEMFATPQSLDLHYHQHHQNDWKKVQFVENASSSLDQVNDPASNSCGSQDLDSYICHQNHELEAFIRLQNQKLQAAVEDSRKRHCRSLVRIIKQRILRKFEEKERELEKVKRLNVELGEKVKQMSAENQMWFNMTMNSEATVFNLRQTLMQLLLYNNNAGNDAIEGFGETDAESPIQIVETEDYAGENNRRQKLTKSCKGCGVAYISVLVLPCRHLCLCKDCESRLPCCPVCNSVKNTTLNVLFS